MVDKMQQQPMYRGTTPKITLNVVGADMTDAMRPNRIHVETTAAERARREER